MLIAGCLFVGLGIGMWLGDAGPGVLIGLGAGFVIQYLVGDAGLAAKWRKTQTEEKKVD